MKYISFLTFTIRMKRILSILLLCLYLISSIGVTVSAHYCEGNLASFAFFETDLNCCCDEGSNGESDDCCRDESKSIQISADQNKAEFNNKEFQTVEIGFLPSVSTWSINKSILKKISALPLFIPDPPENRQLIPAYKRNHSFLFYS